MKTLNVLFSVKSIRAALAPQILRLDKVGGRAYCFSRVESKGLI